MPFENFTFLGLDPLLVVLVFVTRKIAASIVTMATVMLPVVSIELVTSMVVAILATMLPLA